MEGKRRVCKCGPKKSATCLIVGVLLLIFGAVAIPLGFKAIMNFVLKKIMVINPSSPIYKEWKDPTLPMFTEFHFFDLQNPEEVLAGAKPSVVEIGPYSYRMMLPRVNITFNPNDTVSSDQPYTYIFDRSNSAGDENDTFLTANMPFWTVVYFVRDAGSLIKEILEVFLKDEKEKPFVRLSVKDLIWGYDEPIFHWVHKYLPKFPLPKGFEEQFGFLLGRNNTALGRYTSFTGEQNNKRLNIINRFSGMEKLPYWKTDICNAINGTDGMMYHMNIKEDEVLYLFHPDLCRSMPYTYVKDDTLKGVPLKMFGVAPWAYQNGSTYPPNIGFNITSDDVPRGLMRVDPCRYNTPIAISNPHFFDGDPCLQAQVNGLAPNGDKHRNYFSIQQDLGMPFKLHMRLQINQYMQRVSDIGQTKNVRTMYFPAFWFQEVVIGNDEVIADYKNGIRLPGIIAVVLQYLCIAIGASIIVVFLFIGLYRLKIREKSIIINADTCKYFNYESTKAKSSTPLINSTEESHHA